MKRRIISALLIGLFVFSLSGNAILTVSGITAKDVVAPGMSFTFEGEQDMVMAQFSLFEQYLDVSTDDWLYNHTETTDVMVINTTTVIDIEVLSVDETARNVTTEETTAMNGNGVYFYDYDIGLDTDANGILEWSNDSDSYAYPIDDTSTDQGSFTYTTEYFPDYDEFVSDFDVSGMSGDYSFLPPEVATFLMTYSPNIDISSTFSTDTYIINDQSFDLDMEYVNISALDDVIMNGTFDADLGGTVYTDSPYLFQFYFDLVLYLGYDTDTGMLISYYADVALYSLFIFLIYDQTYDTSLVFGFGSGFAFYQDLVMTSNSALYLETTTSVPGETTTPSGTTAPGAGENATETGNATGTTSPGLTLPGFTFLEVIPALFSVFTALVILRKKR